MQDDIRWISTTQDLDRELASAGSGPVAVDCEADSLHRYPEKVCLIQLTFGDRDLLVDPLAGLDVTQLGDLLGDPDRRKLLHGADYDLRMLQRDFGIQIRGLFDTMVAARVLGETAFGLAALVERRLGVVLDKRFQRADWSQRPLTQEMREYAARDTRYLEPLADGLEEALEASGRAAWAQEEFALLEQTQWSAKPDDGKRFHRVKGVARLRPDQQGVLRELYEMREQLALGENRPPFRIARDEVLLQLAQEQPQQESELRNIRGIPRRWLRSRGSRDVIAAIRRGQAVDPQTLPKLEQRIKKKRSSAFESGVKRLRQVRDELAAELGLEPSFLATRSVLEQIRDRLDRGVDLKDIAGLRHWQAELLLPAIRKVS